MPLSRDAEELAERLRGELRHLPGYDEKRMFGGLCMLLNGNMCCGVTGDGRLLVRVGPQAYQEALRQPHAAEMDFTGQPLKGMVFVHPAGVETDDGLARWVGLGVGFAGALPPK